MLGSIPTPGRDEDVVLYVYDIAMAEGARGKGYLKRLVDTLPCQVCVCVCMSLFEASSFLFLLRVFFTDMAS